MWSPGLSMAVDDPLDGLGHERVRLVEVDEAAGHDLGPADEVAGLLVDGDHDHEHAVVGERAAVAQHDVADLAHRQAVDVHVAGRRPGVPRRAEPSAKNSIGLPFSMMKMFSGATPSLDRQAAVLDQHPELAVDRDEVLRLGQVEHQLQLFLAGVAGDVRALDGVVVDVGAGLEQVVDRARDVLLVARDRARADDDRVAGLDLHEAVVAVGHPRQAGHRLALGAGRGDDELVVGDVLEPVLGDDACAGSYLR